MAARVKEELKGRSDWVAFKSPLPTVRQAKQALKDGKADINHRLTLLVYEARTQQWDEVRKHFDEISKIIGEKTGRRWLEFAVQMMTRRNEELRQGITAEMKRLADQAVAKRETNNAYAMVTALFSQAASVLQGNEMLELLDVIRPVYTALPAYAQGDKAWKQQRVSYLQNVGQPDAAFALLSELAKAHRYDYSLATQYANQLAGRGEHEAAYAWLRELVADQSLEWHAWELDQFAARTCSFWNKKDGWRIWSSTWLTGSNWSRKARLRISSISPRCNGTARKQRLMSWSRSGCPKGGAAIVETAKRNEGKKPHEHQPVPAAKSAQLSAAVNYATGNYGPYWNSRLEEKWIQPLAETVRVVMRHGDPSWIANTIMNHQHFRNLDAARDLRREFVELLLKEGRKTAARSSESARGLHWSQRSEGRSSYVAADRRTARQALGRGKGDGAAERAGPDAGASLRPHRARRTDRISRTPAQGRAEGGPPVARAATVRHAADPAVAAAI